MDVDRTWGSTLVKNHDENKTYILVKLSESFSNAIQEYSAPKIKFHGSRGAIKFPNGKSYDFSLEQSDNTVECIRQTKNKWQSVGKVACCLHVKGKDDVYQRTRTKMEAAEQEKRKYCTKLLGSPEHESIDSTPPPTKSNRTTTSTVSANHNSSSYPSHNSHHSNNVNNHHHHHHNNHSSNRSSKLMDNSSNNKSSSSSSYNNLSSTAQSLAAPISSGAVVSDLKSSLLSSLSTGSATSSSSSTASSTSVAPATSNHNNNNNNSNNNNHVYNLSKFPDIANVEQMHRYKAEFDKDFKEYQHLHGYLHRIEERFRKLKEKLKRSSEGSPEWESAKEEIFNEYERLKGDSNFHKARSKYQQLYNKLNHIKKKIFQFKHEHRDKCNSRKKRKR